MFEIVYRCNPAEGPTQTRPKDAEQARTRLVQGNQQYTDLIKSSADPDVFHQDVISLDLSAFGIAEDSASVPRQQPFAAVLSCSDARVPVEMIFHQACNDLFVVRLAGNVMTNECVGSIGYAVRHLDDSVKLVVVLGHSCCGAVNAAVDSYLSPANYPGTTSDLGMRSIIDRVLVSVRAGAQSLKRVGITQASDESHFRERLLDLSVVLNSAMMAMSLQQVMSEVVSVGCPVVYGIYDLATRVVWAPHLEPDSQSYSKPHLADPPSSAAEFESLADRLASSSEALS